MSHNIQKNRDQSTMKVIETHIVLFSVLKLQYRAPFAIQYTANFLGSQSYFCRPAKSLASAMPA